VFWYNLGITLIEKFAITVSLKFISIWLEGDSTIHTLCLIADPNLITHSRDVRALPMVLTCPVHVSAAFVKLRSSLHLGARPIGQPTLPVLPIARRKGLTEDVEPSRLRKRHLADDDGVQNVCEDDGCGANIAERELLRCDAPGCALTVSLTEISR
jgi:hypothetical protein